MAETVLFIAPHPDDEVLGAGGTIARYSAEGKNVYVLIATKASPPLYTDKDAESGRTEARAAHSKLGVKETFFFDFPAAMLDQVPCHVINKEFCGIINHLRPHTIFIPHIGDIHNDHQVVFNSTMVASRPNNDYYPRRILSYETLSETNWNAPNVTPAFIPNMYVDITQYLPNKIAAWNAYASQHKLFPLERSTETINALSMLRGSAMNMRAAEAFIILRNVE